MSEVAQAVVEAKLKMSDINTAVHICSLLHQRYHDFAPTLLENWQKVLALKKDEKVWFDNPVCVCSLLRKEVNIPTFLSAKEAAQGLQKMIKKGFYSLLL